MSYLPLSPLNGPAAGRQAGTTLLEVLITVVVLAFGLLGIAAFQAKAQVGSIEAYQRAQAIVLLEDMQARMTGNSTVPPANYVTTDPLGFGNTAYTSCDGLAGVDFDKCEWSTALKGAAEVKGSDKIGAMTGARGCVEEIQAPNATDGACLAGIYQITVAWQGMHPTVAPALACGKDAYGADSSRRAISARVSFGTPTCKLSGLP